MIKVVGQNDRTWFDRSGNFHSDLMEVTERFRFVDPNTVRYEATIVDEQVYTEPWTLSLLLYRRQAEDAMLHQFKCVEFVEELMYGHLRKPQEDSYALSHARTADSCNQ